MLAYQHDLMPLLKQRESLGNPIRIGLLGCGSMGGDLLDQMNLLPGMRIVAIADRRTENIFKQCHAAQFPNDSLIKVDTVEQANALVNAGNIAITNQLDLIGRIEAIDVVIDATGKPSVGAQHGITALQNRKHLVMMNVESDVTVGALLAQIARDHQVVYTLGMGDEPSSTLELVHFVQNMGLEVIAAGKGKNNPMNPYVTPNDLREEATSKKMNPRVLSEFVDGTKTMVEMTALANATGFAPDCDGMHGLDAPLEELNQQFIPIEQGGVLHHRGVVDYSIGARVAPGVFVVGYNPSPRLCERMAYLALGDGPYYTFYRPYHLTSLEVPISVARAVLFGVCDMQPRNHPVAEACGRAKRIIKAGETLDGIGETCYYGWTMRYDRAKQQRVIPLGLLGESVAKRDIAQDELLSLDNCQPDTKSPLYQLRLQQDKTV